MAKSKFERSMSSRTVVLPACRITETCNEQDEGAVGISASVVPNRKVTYFVRPVGAVGSLIGYNLLPVILNGSGVPWDIANIYLLARLEGTPNPEMSTFAGIADDLSAYRQFLDERPEIDFSIFPQHKLRRPTYRYNGYLKQLIFAGVLEASTVRRRMSTVVAFYRWMIREGVLNPSNDPWQEREFLASFVSAEGVRVSKAVKSTDIAIRAPVKDAPYEGNIVDGGRLRPLSQVEQIWILEALGRLGNVEMTLIHLVALLTGARIQTVLTIRKHHVTCARPHGAANVLLKCGPGHDIDTKGDVLGMLHVPRNLYEMLRTYAKSTRAILRNERACDKGMATEYLFLTQQGTPYYQAKAERLGFDPDSVVRYQKKGQPVRQFIVDHVVPFVRKHHDRNFNYRFHDLRASFGMNETDRQLELVTQGKSTLSRARFHVQKLMWHASAATTDLYLDYRRQMEMASAAVDGHEAHIARLIGMAMSGDGRGW